MIFIYTIIIGELYKSRIRMTKKTKRCAECNKRVGNLPFDCTDCGKLHCGDHRTAHNCPEFLRSKELRRQCLAINNQKIEVRKVVKI